MYFYLKSGVDLIKEGRQLVRDHLQNEILQTMAYTDSLTHIGNRFAFEKEKEQLENLKDTNVIIMVADLNGLKSANDNYGHAYGDEVIRKTAELLTEIFNGVGKCYRTGGDEFLVLADNISRSTFDKCVENMNSSAQKINKAMSVYGIAYGIAEGSAHEIDDIFREADGLMYKCKKEMKSKLHYSR